MYRLFSTPFVIRAGTVVVWASALAAQASPNREPKWARYRAPDSSFVVMFTRGGPAGPFTHNVAPTVKITTYWTQVGTTQFSVTVQDNDWYQRETPSATLDRFCKSATSLVVCDSVLQMGRYEGRRAHVDTTRPNAAHNSDTRLFVTGPRVYVVRVGFQRGQPLSPYANFFLESFTICNPTGPCMPPNASAAPRADRAASAPTPGVTAPVDPARIHSVLQVEKPVRTAPGSVAPHFPDTLKAAGIEGEVLASFVVDTTGRVEIGSFKVLKATHHLMADAVMNALPAMRFYPAEQGGRKVRQLVQQPFVFKIMK